MERKVSRDKEASLLASALRKDSEIAYDSRVRGQSIPGPVYNQIKKTVPVTVVDIIVKTEDGVLLGRRTNEPLKGELCFVGGRVYYGESFEEAASRKVREETGLEVKIENLVGVYSLYYTKGEERHDTDLIFLGTVVGGRLKTDDQHSGFSVINDLNVPLPRYVRQALVDSKVFENGVQETVTTRFFAE